MSAVDPADPATPYGIVRTDASGTIVEANAWFRRWAATDGDALLGIRLTDVFDRAAGDLLPHESASGPFLMTLASDPERAVMVATFPEGDAALHVLTEASERYRALVALRSSYALADRTATRLQLIIESAIAFSTAGTEAELAGILARTAERAYRAEHAAVLFQPAPGVTSQIGDVAPSPVELPEELLYIAVAARRVMTVSSMEADSSLPAAARDSLVRAGVRALILAPIAHEGASFGALVVVFLHDRTFDREAAPLAEAFVGQAGQALATLRLQSRLAYAATHDDVTGLPNRRMLELSAPESPLERCAVLFVDVDGFKSVNDELGHHAGDGVLREVGRRLQAIVRETDTVVRFGGDEFVVIADVHDDAGALEIAERIRARIRDGFPGLPEQRTLGASIGLVVAEAGSTPIESLIRLADQAMYRAKAAGGDRVSQAPGSSESIVA